MRKLDKSTSYFLFISWLCYLIITSVLLFTKGFLLTRTVQKANSTCSPLGEVPCVSQRSSVINVSDSFKEQCSINERVSSVIGDFSTASSVCLPPKARVILLIVDALRYDFTVYDDSLSNPLPYQNKLPVIRDLLNKYPEQTKLYKCMADPPTTTMQRLKALTTGSLPTFIDAGSNFATSEINEDNIIDQLVSDNQTVVFMGDDTWNGLYPNRFKRNYPYPSFNVWDLDTVDNGVRENLFQELNNSDWSLLIGHFLGVDHCGHRYGPHHPEMKRKLGEIDDVIKNVVEHIDGLDDNVMLFVIGDHGMTVTGDHGGESADEVSAGLFIYSKQTLFKFSDAKTVKQIDVVPTLSTILGVSVPFQSLGILIPDCLPLSNSTSFVENWQVALYHSWSNVKQMLQYIKVYSESETIFDKDLLDKFDLRATILHGKLYTIDEMSFVEFYDEISQFLSELRQMCEGIWIQFESFSMARGLVLLFLSAFFVYIITDGIPVSRLPEVFVSSFLACSFGVLLAAVLGAGMAHYLDATSDLQAAVFFATGMVSQVMLGMLIIQNWELICLNWYARSRKEKIPNLICRLILIFNLCGLFSNSYIIEESSVLLYLLITIILVGTAGIAARVGGKKKSSLHTKVKLVLLALFVATLARSSMYFWRCREEQQWCFATPHEVSFITMKMETTKLQWAFTIVFLIVFVFATKEWLKHCGNLNGYSITVLFAKYLPTVIVVCIAGFWVIKKAPPSKKVNPFKPLNILAWTVYGLIALGVVSCVVRPLCVYVIPSLDSVRDPNMIPKLFRKIKNSLSNAKEENRDVPVICGLGTVYSSVFIIIAVYLTLLFALLLGDAVAPSAMIMFVTAAFVSIIMSVVHIEKANTVDDLFDIPNMSVLIWIIFAQYFFYGTGHQPTFPNIQWEAAFIGTSGIFFNNFIAGALVILNTFCSFILTGVTLPLVLIVPFTIFVMVPTLAGKKPELLAVLNRGEVVLYEKKDLMYSSMLTLGCKYIIGHAIRVFASMLAATIHCRHLMVWNIFAPKLIFESIGMLVTVASVLIGYLILVRINKQVEGLILALKKMS